MENSFTSSIRDVLKKHFGKDSEDIFEKSQLIQYINEKTRSANSGSKSRSSFGSLYTLYTIIKDYLENSYDIQGDYSKHEGPIFSLLLKKAKEMPFGSKLQNHYFNNRTNSEFQKYFPSSEFIPILQNQETRRYWINENLLKIRIGSKNLNISNAVVEIIDNYIKVKQDSFERFIKSCIELQKIKIKSPKKVIEFIGGSLAPNVDARLFEIVSYAILKYYYSDQIIIWGFEMDKLNSETLKLYKTGRTNANDGGIDFVMKPLGRFFQVTETLDFRKYFLDIDKIQKYPITFVIKADEPVKDLLKKIRQNANKTYSVETIVNKYMACIEEVINIPILNDRFEECIKQGYINNILHEIIIQSKVEFNYEEEADE